MDVRNAETTKGRFIMEREKDALEPAETPTNQGGGGEADPDSGDDVKALEPPDAIGGGGNTTLSDI
jgi:hypothetical protein